MGDAAERSFARGAVLFDAGAFFEAHEAWEDHWRVATDEEERRAFQGLIQIAAGLHKLVVMGSPVSAARLLEKGVAKLEASAAWASGDAWGVDAEERRAFAAGVRACASAIAAGSFERAAVPRLVSALATRA